MRFRFDRRVWQLNLPEDKTPSLPDGGIGFVSASPNKLLVSLFGGTAKYNKFKKNPYQYFNDIRNPLLRQLKYFYKSVIPDNDGFNQEMETAQNAAIAEFCAGPTRSNSILLIEPNDCHGEILPGLAQYLIQAGYAVDVLITPAQHAKAPLAQYQDASLRVFVLDCKSMGKVLASEKPAAYEFLFFNSCRVYRQLGENRWPSIHEYYSQITPSKHGLLVMGHQMEFPNMEMLQEGRIATLTDLGPDLPLKPFIVNTHFFGQIEITGKSDLPHFIMVGSMENYRRNCSLLHNAVRHLDEKGIRRFKITLIGRGGFGKISARLHPYFEHLGSVDYPTMYAKMAEADFFLPLLDPENPEHDRYLSTGTSGSFQLIYGFQKPCLIAAKFAQKYGFNATNSIPYDTNAELALAMERAIAMSPSEYKNMQAAIGRYAEKLYAMSLHNVSSALIRLKETYKQHSIRKDE